MNSGARHSAQRSARVRLKADAVILLDRIVAHALSHGAMKDDRLQLEIAEMRMRLAPPPGVKAPIVRTGYTKEGRR
jgi:hypothetical protein